MKTAIFYASKHGATEQVALQLRQLLGEGDTLLFNLRDKPTPSWDEYDRVIVGAPIYAGNVMPEAAAFCKRYEAMLLGKPLGLYLCAMNEDQYDDEFDRAFPESLRRHAASRQVVGGAFNFDSMNFVERFIVRRIAGVKRSVTRIRQDRIAALAEAMHKAGTPS